MEAALRNYFNPRPYWIKDAIVIATTIGVAVLIGFVYMKLKPTVVIPPPGVVSKCPARWSFNVSTGECEPQYSTKCLAFNPDTIGDKEKCEIVKACGTYWKGLCDYT